MNEIRTPNGKLVGMVDARTGTFHIKDGKKTTAIEIPATGLRIQFSSGNGTPEIIYVPPRKSQPLRA